MNQKVTIAYQGIPGAYSQQAIHEFAKNHLIEVNTHACSTFEELFNAIKTKTGIGMVPIKNSISGMITQCCEYLQNDDFEIILEKEQDIKHCLLAKRNTTLKDIHYVYSHPQALIQCSEFLEQNNLIPVPYFDTAGAARYLNEIQNKNSAAIASEIASRNYNLEIINSHIENSKKNTTQFFLVKLKSKHFQFEENTSLNAEKIVMDF